MENLTEAFDISFCRRLSYMLELRPCFKLNSEALRMYMEVDNKRRDVMKPFWRAILMFLFTITGLILITIFSMSGLKSYATSDKVITEIEKRGFAVDVKDVDKDILAGERKWLTIDQKEYISIFIYDNKNDMQEDADCISNDGCSYKRLNKIVNVSWTSFPHFYKINNIIVLYVGESRQIIDTLEAICGEQFAGYKP